MRIAPRHLKLAAVAVFTITGVITVTLVLIALVFGTFIAALAPTKPPRLLQGALILFAILLPAIGLIRFYFKAIFRCPSRPYLVAGWSTSAIYHAGLSLLMIRYLPGASLDTVGLSVPLWVPSMLALLLSTFLVAYSPKICGEYPPPP